MSRRQVPLDDLFFKPAEPASNASGGGAAKSKAGKTLNALRRSMPASGNYYDDEEDDFSDGDTVRTHLTAEERSLEDTMSHLTLGGVPTLSGMSSSEEDCGEEEASSDQAAIVKYDMRKLPEHACRYCGIHNPATVVKCMTCSKWFCNGRGGGVTGMPALTAGSHILHHLVKGKHKECMLHPSSPVGDAILECYACGCRNIFLLGFIPAKADTVVVLLCRQPCVQASSRDDDWDVASWTPLISDRCLLPWLVATPAEDELRRSCHATTEQLNALEELWKTNPGGTLDDLTRAGQEEDLMATQLRYDDAFHYQAVFAPLVRLEADYDRSLKEAQVLESVAIRWDVGLNMRHIAWFLMTASYGADSDFRVAPGDEVEITYAATPSRRWTGKGAVVRVPATYSEEISVEIRDGGYVPTDLTAGFHIQFVWKPTSYERMQQALRTLAVTETCVGPSVYQRLMGIDGELPSLDIDLPKRISAPHLPELNHSQAHAVRSAIQKPFSLIQGPPGTGKTVTTATLVYNLVRAGRGPVLVCAPSNVAVDHLTEKIHLTGLRVVRLAAKWREAVDSSISFLCLHEQIHALQTAPEFQKLAQLKKDQGELSAADEGRYLRLKTRCENEILSAADVVLATCTGSGAASLSRLRFRTVLIDEATQATEPESLIALVHGAEQVILVGDHRQLGPVIMNKKAAKAGLKTSLFERLIALGIRPIRLQVQYRMHPCLSEFPSNMFYDGSLQNGVTDVERSRREVDFPWPDPSNPMLFLGSYGTEELSTSGTSYLNRSEAVFVEKAVTHFMRGGVLPTQIGVITPYEGQRAYLLQHMHLQGPLRKELYAEIEVASVDAFQGREKDFIILSCVRSNDHQGIGFLSDARRLNVALTRARYGLMIIGNPRVLARNNLWSNLLAHFKLHGVLMEGSLTSMRSSLMQFQRQSERPVHAHRASLASIGAAALGITEEAFLTDDETASQLTQDSYQNALLGYL